MKRWSTADGEDVEAPKVDAFLAEVGEVCRRHRLQISHEDAHGAFIVSALDEGEDPLDTLGWANLDRTVTPDLR